MIRWFASKLTQHGHKPAARVVLGWAEAIDRWPIVGKLGA